jgi:hypothetical protein
MATAKTAILIKLTKFLLNKASKKQKSHLDKKNAVSMLEGEKI